MRNFGGRWLGGEPAFEGLVEAFDLALGLRVAGVAVLLVDAELAEKVFKAVAAAGESGGVDAPVVGERRGRGAVAGDEAQERADDGRPGDPGVGGARQQQPGVVVEPVQDLHVGAVCQVPMGEVGLPALVGLGGLEAAVGAARPLMRLRGDQPGGVQDPPDRRSRRNVPVFGSQPRRDGDRAGV